MSSEPTTFADAVASLGSAVDRALETRSEAELEAADVAQMIASTVRLYFARSEAGVVQPLDPTAVSATEALTLVGALLTSQNINAFDLALWLSHLDAMPSSPRQ